MWKMQYTSRPKMNFLEKTEDWLDKYATKILDAKYNKTNVNDVVQQHSHLSASQKKDLLELLTTYSKLFSGKLGSYPHKKFTSTSILKLLQYMHVLIQYHIFTWKPFIESLLT